MKFSPVAFWSLTAVYEAFSAKWAVRNEAGVWVSARAGTQAEVLHAQAEGERHRHVVEQVESKPVEQRPKPPFTTSTLQQTASARLNFKPDKTMTVAQSLFEVGAITYHRTDSVALSDEAIALAREWISKVHPSALPNSPVRYRAAAQSQEAHEAVRPTAANVDAATKLTADEAALLDLIRLRFFASQCAPAVIQRTTIRIRAGEAHFVAIGSVVTVPSFLKFLECDEEKDEPKVEERANLPLLEVGQQLAPIRFAVAAESTKPPPRFTQATLVREMERCGIGRPSTFASTLKTLFDRNYIGEEKKSVVPTPRGQLIDGAVSASFPKIVDAEYTALMERRLDEVATGRRRWIEELREWHGSFSRYLREAPGAIAKWMEANRDLVDAASDAPRVTDRTCPRCGLALVLRQGKTGPFLACSGFPACAYSADPSVQGSVLKCPNCDGSMEELDGKFGHWARCVRASCAGRRGVARNTDDACPRCKSPMLDKGEFLGCSQFPACRFSVDRKLLQKALKKARSCPKCTRLFVEKKGPRGKFLSCVGYPECRHTQAVPAKKGKAHV